MLTDHRAYATLPVADMGRAKAWYQEKLGLTPSSEDPGGAMYTVGSGSMFMLYPSSFAGSAGNTAMEFNSTDVRADVAALRAKGVVFQDYDMPGLKTEDGVAMLGPTLAAWFKDSEGNILALGDALNH